MCKWFYFWTEKKTTNNCSSNIDVVILSMDDQHQQIDRFETRFNSMYWIKIGEKNNR